MKQITKTALAALIAGASFVATTSAAQAQDKWVRIHNKSSVILYGWRSSPTSANKWGPDRLVSKQIPPGYATTINLNNAGSGCYFDFRAEFIDGDILETRNRNVCGGFDMTYTD